MPTDTRDSNAAHPLAEPHLDADAFDELTELFLGSDTESNQAGRAPARTRPIEIRALVVGHLPVAASPWVSQHARDLAGRLKAPVALLSRSGGHASLSVFGMPPGTPSPKSSSSLDHAVAQAHSMGIAAWIVRTDALDELALAEHHRLTGVTLLTGADEAALVNAYRALKALTAAAPGYEPAIAALHLAVLGSHEDQARLAAEKLRKAAESFLDTGLTSVTLTEKVGPGQGIRLFDGSVDRDIDEIIDALPTAPLSRPQPQARVASPSPSDTSTPTLRLSHGDAEQASRIGPNTSGRPTIDADGSSEPIDSLGAATDRDASLAMPYAESPSAALPTSLAGLLGLTPLEPRCPYADEVEIAADAEGRAHLIVHAPGAAHAIPGALESLEIARSWLAAHLTLLAAATNNAVRSNPPREPAAHLVVDHAASVRRLLDAQVRVYVLAAGRAESLCVPLN